MQLGATLQGHWAFHSPRERPPGGPSRACRSPLLAFPTQQWPWLTEHLDGNEPAWVTHPHGPVQE